MNTECHIVSRSETWTSAGTYLYWHAVFLSAGYVEIFTSWEQSNEESNPLWYPYHHCLLYGGRVRWICSFWRWCPGKPAHRIWILQSVLASWLCKRLYCCASGWRISGAHLCFNPMYGPLIWPISPMCLDLSSYFRCCFCSGPFRQENALKFCFQNIFLGDGCANCDY